MESSQPSTSRNVNHAGNSATTIPLKITFEILSRLPAKSIIRFQSVSKQWLSIIHSKDFANAFLTRSRDRPRLLFTFQHFDSAKCFIFSAPEHEKGNDDKSSSTVVIRHDMTISNLGSYDTSAPVNGLMCCTLGSSIAVCNPTTRQLVILPDVRANGRVTHARLGYDPVEDEYKVLCVMMPDGRKRGRTDIKQEHLVFGLRSKYSTWRRVETPTGEPYTEVEGGICINGAIYYGVGHEKIARFDLKREKIMFIEAPKDDITSWNFINHQGKSEGIEYDFYCDVIQKSFRSVEVKGIADYEFRRINGIGKHDRDMLCFPGYIENIQYL